ncbi:MAG: histidine kinase [Bacteroidota bacterium]
MYRSNTRSLAFLLMGILYYSFSIAQQNPYYLTYDTAHGLPSPETYDVHTDKNNRIWILTDRGICTYNGHEFQTYTTANGIAFNTNFEIHEDKQGGLWFTGFDGSLTVFKGRAFRPFKFNHKLFELNPHSWLEHISFDGQNIFFGCYPYFLSHIASSFYSMDTTTGELSQLEAIKVSDCTGRKRDSCELFKVGNGYFLSIDGERTAPAKEGFDGTLVCSSGNTIFSLKPGTGKLEEYTFETIVNNFTADPEGTIWACTGDGLYRFRSGLDKGPEEIYFKGVTPTGISLDTEGNHWVSTLEKGVLQIPSFDVKRLLEENHPVYKEKVMCFATVGRFLVFGTSNGNVYSVDSNLLVSPVLLANNGHQVKAIPVSSDGSGRLWKKYITDNGNGPLAVKSDSINLNIWTDLNLFHELSDGSLFCGSPKGFSIKNHKGDSIFYKGALPYGKSTCLEEDSQGIVWIGTIKGLYQFSWQTDRVLSKTLDDHFCSDARITDLKARSAGNIWVGTAGNGILNVDGDSITNISTKEGLASNIINRIHMVADTALWVATNNGLSYIDLEAGGFPTVNNVKSYSTKDGLPSNYIYDVTDWNGHLWVATDKGVAYFHRSALDRPQPFPVTVLDHVTSKGGNYRDSVEYKFPPLNNDFVFGFTGISHSKQLNSPFYSYQLQKDGAIADTWIESTERNVNFTDIPPGKYSFQVRAKNREGNWGEPAEYHFEVLPLFTQTGLFRIGTIAFSILVVISLATVHSQNQRNKERQRRAVQENLLRAKLAELSALRSQMNPHFVFNALNAVQNFIFKNDKEKANHFLSRFSALIRQGLAHSRMEVVRLDKEIGFVRAYLELENMRFPDRFIYNIEVPSGLDTECLMVPPFLIQPLIENSINHGFKGIGRKGNLNILFSPLAKDNTLEIMVQDNGKGLSGTSKKELQKGDKKMSFGLDIVSERIRLFNEKSENGKASILLEENKDGKGFTVRLVIPVLLGKT